MFGERLELITLQCRVCKQWVALRVDKDDLDRHRHGVFVQHAFVRRDGRPYLSAAERELFPACSATCESCYSLLCPDPIAHPYPYFTHCEFAEWVAFENQVLAEELCRPHPATWIQRVADASRETFSERSLSVPGSA